MPDGKHVSVMTEVLVCADHHGCALCGISKARHGDRFGLGHLGRPPVFIAPSADLIARRLAARSSGGYEIAEIDSGTGAPSTYLVRTACRCGSTALATVEHAPTAKCENCLREVTGGAA
jgi:hypothetical protein